MRILLDTCALSEIRHPQGNPTVKTTIAAFPDDDIYLSAVSIGEIAKGIALLDDGARKSSLLTWLQGLETGYDDRILTVDTETARTWGELTARAQRAGRQVAMADGLIAATALRHGLHIVTRNVSDFEPTGALLLNPWDETAN